MTSAVEIRRAHPGDAATLARLRYAFRSELDPPSEPESAFVQRCTRWMAGRLGEESWCCWLALSANTGVGTLWLQLVEKIPNPVGHPDYHGYVTSVYVVPQLRGAGIGSALLKACLAEADVRGLDALFLWPTERSRPLYGRHGFRATDDLLERRRAVQASGS